MQSYMGAVGEPEYAVGNGISIEWTMSIGVVSSSQNQCINKFDKSSLNKSGH